MYFQNWRGRKKCDWLGWDSLGPAKRQKDEKAEICWRGWQTQFVLSILFSLLFIFSQTHSLQKDFYKKRHRHRFHIQNALLSLNLNCRSLNLHEHALQSNALDNCLLILAEVTGLEQPSGNEAFTLILVVFLFSNIFLFCLVQSRESFLDLRASLKLSIAQSMHCTSISTTSETVF